MRFCNLSKKNISCERFTRLTISKYLSKFSPTVFLILAISGERDGMVSCELPR